MKTAGTVVKYKKWFEARISYTDHATGRRVYIRRKRKTKTDARLTLDELKRELKKKGGIERQSDRMTFDELAVKYEQARLVAATYRGEKKVAGLRDLKAPKTILKMLRGHFGNRQVKAITHGDLERFRNLRFNTPTKWGGERSVASVNREMAMMVSVLRFAVRNGWLEKSPFDAGESLIRPADENKRGRVMSYEEEARLLSVCTGPLERLGVMIVLAVDTGIRRGEMLRLEWPDIDFDSRLIRLRQITTKNNKPREAAMTERVMKELRRWREQMPADEPLVFGLRSNFNTHWSLALERANIEGLHWHDIRHTCATRLTAAGIPIAEAMRLTGHATTSMLYRYINPGPDALHRAADALEQHHRENGGKTIESSMVN
ncbi:MAG TPA: site-specific integrase [Blastocatellia bacterium]|nr:site-specific integrase [Blastocatellia bacterium]